MHARTHVSETRRGARAYMRASRPRASAAPRESLPSHKRPAPLAAVAAKNCCAALRECRRHVRGVSPVSPRPSTRDGKKTMREREFASRVVPRLSSFSPPSSLSFPSLRVLFFPIVSSRNRRRARLLVPVIASSSRLGIRPMRVRYRPDGRDISSETQQTSNGTKLALPSRLFF